jgi:hypothetical protein
MLAVLPILIDEHQVFTFKFWFNGKIQNGMYYRNELFCQLGTYTIQHRSRVYQLGCHLTQRDAFSAITCSATSCCLWGSLRSELVKQLLADPSTPALAALKRLANQDYCPDHEQNHSL